MRLIVLSLVVASVVVAVQGAPVIITQPQSQTHILGDDPVFWVEASGAGKLTYQWRKNGVPLTDDGHFINTAQFYLLIRGITESDAGNYSVKITDPADGGSLTSDNAQLTVLVPPAITQQPVGKEVLAGSSVTFTVTATGSAPLRYQWRADGFEIPVATNATLTLTSVRGDQEGEYTVVVSNEAVDHGAAAAVSEPATLTVLVAPRIILQPESVVAVEGDDVEFEVEINDDVTDTFEYELTYQWRKGGSNLEDEQDSILSLYDIEETDAGNYTVKIMNGVGTVISANATLTVYVPPEITTQPASQTVELGDRATFTVKATGTPAPLSYQWFFDDEEIPGETNSTLAFVVTDPGQAGAYSVTVSNALAAMFDDDEYIALSEEAILTVQTEKVKPKVTITKPAEGVRWSNAEVNVEGKATDNVAVNEVLWRVNRGDWQQAHGITVAASTPWSALSVPLRAGSNVFEVQSIDTSGNKSAFAERRIYYVYPSLFTLLTNGVGTVTFTPAIKTNLLEIGRGYKVTSKPGKDQVFAGWSGDVVSTNPTLTFLMRTGLVLQANFIPNPFTPVKGVYNGLFYQTSGVKHDTAGFFTMTLTDKGSYSGKLFLGGGRYPFKGVLWVDGTSTASVPRKGLSPLTLNLRVDLTNGTDQVEGSVKDNVWMTSSLWGDRQVFSSLNPAPQVGKYTVALLQTTNHVTLPGGDGSGTIAVSSVGLLKFTGTLADGAKVIQSVGISKNGQWPFYVNLYKGKGSTLGWGTFTNRDTGSLEGDVSWIKQAVPDKFYPNGFTTEVQLLGSHYVQPSRGVRVLDIGPGEVVFSDGSLAAPLTNSVFLTTNNTLTVTAGTNKLMLKFTLSTGAASGRFIHPVTKKSSKISGVLLPEDNTLRGSFLSTNLSGAVILRATSP